MQRSRLQSCCSVRGYVQAGCEMVQRFELIFLLIFQNFGGDNSFTSFPGQGV